MIDVASVHLTILLLVPPLLDSSIVAAVPLNQPQQPLRPQKPHTDSLPIQINRREKLHEEVHKFPNYKSITQENWRNNPMQGQLDYQAPSPGHRLDRHGIHRTTI